VRAVESDDHGVPFGAGLAGFGERLGKGIERAGNVGIVFVGGFWMIVDLHFVAVVNGHPGFARLDGDADEEARIVIQVAHFIDHADAAVADLAASPVKQAHAAVRLDQAVFDRVATRADVLPAGEIFAVEQRLPVRFLGIGGDGERKNSKCESCD